MTPSLGSVLRILPGRALSKLIISHLVGKRLARNCLSVMNDISERVQGRSQLSTDGFPAYSGPNGAVARAFGSDVDYGTEVKAFGREEGPPGRYTPAKCLGVEREAQIGNPDLRTVGTSRVERMNLSVRHFTRRFTRSTLRYSKRFRNHRHATALFIAHFNFCRTHSSPEKWHRQNSGNVVGIDGSRLDRRRALESVSSSINRD